MTTWLFDKSNVVCFVQRWLVYSAMVFWIVPRQGHPVLATVSFTILFVPITCGFHRACLTLLAVSTVVVCVYRFPTASTVFVWFNDFPGALSFCDVCVLVRVLFWDSQCPYVQFLCRFVLLLIKEALSSLRAGSSELVSRQVCLLHGFLKIVTGLQISRGAFAVWEPLTKPSQTPALKAFGTVGSLTITL